MLQLISHIRDLWRSNGRTEKIEKRAQKRRARLARLAERGLRVGEGEGLGGSWGAGGSSCCGCGSGSGGLGSWHGGDGGDDGKDEESAGQVLEADLDPLAEMREMLRSADEDRSCFRIARGGVAIRMRRVLTVCSPFSFAVRSGYEFTIAPAARVEDAARDWARSYCAAAGLDHDAFIQTMRKWYDARVLVQPPMQGSEEGLARAGGVMAREMSASLQETCVRNSMMAAAKGLYNRYAEQAKGRRQAAAAVLGRLVKNGKVAEHKQWVPLQHDLQATERAGVQRAGGAWSVVAAALLTAGKEGRGDRRRAQGLSVEGELARACKDAAAGAAHALADPDEAVRCAAISTLARLGIAHLQGCPHQRLAILPDPPRGRPPHPPVPPAPDPFVESEVVGARTEAGSFYTRSVRYGCRDRSTLVREVALNEAAGLAAAQGWCGRWFGKWRIAGAAAPPGHSMPRGRRSRQGLGAASVCHGTRARRPRGHVEGWCASAADKVGTQGRRRF